MQGSLKQRHYLHRWSQISHTHENDCIVYLFNPVLLQLVIITTFLFSLINPQYDCLLSCQVEENQYVLFVWGLAYQITKGFLGGQTRGSYLTRCTMVDCCQTLKCNKILQGQRFFCSYFLYLKSNCVLSQKHRLAMTCIDSYASAIFVLSRQGFFCSVSITMTSC